MKRKGLLDLMDFSLSPSKAKSIYNSGGEYVLCSAVENDILILMFYRRRNLDHRMPEIIIFATKDDYISVVLTEEEYKWRTGCLARILEYGAYMDQYSTWINKRDIVVHMQHDKEQINRFLSAKEDDDTMSVIYNFQYKVMKARLNKKLKKITDKYDKQMEVVPAIPDDFEEWVDQVPLAFSRYLVYKRERNTINAFCTYCKTDITLEYAKHNEKGTCPYCGSAATYKAEGRAKRIYDKANIQLMQKVHYEDGSEEIILRYFEARRDLMFGNIRNYKDYISENGREFYSNGGLRKTYGYSLFRQRELRWNDESAYYSQTGYLYPHNVSDVLKDTSWKYSAIDIMASHNKPFNTYLFLLNYNERPAIEYLAKIGLHNMANALISHYEGDKNIDLKARKIRDVLKIGMEYIPQLKRIDATYGELEIIKQAIDYNVKLTDEQICWIYKYSGYNGIFRCLEYTTIYKAIKYLDKFVRTSHNALGDWFDYLGMCKELKYDMKNSFVLFPKSLKSAHDEATTLIKYKKDKALERQYKKLLASYQDQFEMQAYGLMIVAPKTLMDIVKEGKTLHHCVGGYTKRVANKDTVILFIRDTHSPDKSFYTMEVREGKVIQVRGQNNCATTPKVEKLINKFKATKLSRKSTRKQIMSA